MTRSNLNNRRERGERERKFGWKMEPELNKLDLIELLFKKKSNMKAKLIIKSVDGSTHGDLEKCKYFNLNCKLKFLLILQAWTLLGFSKKSVLNFLKKSILNCH